MEKKYTQPGKYAPPWSDPMGRYVARVTLARLIENRRPELAEKLRDCMASYNLSENELEDQEIEALDKLDEEVVRGLVWEMCPDVGIVISTIPGEWKDE
jgi:hypothetical protein